jgi:hypothetical protein
MGRHGKTLSPWGLKPHMLTPLGEVKAFLA